MRKSRWRRGGALTLAATALTGCGGAAEPASVAEQRPGTSPVQIDAESTPPWPAPTRGVPDLVAAAGLDLGPMGMADHYHPRLTLRIKGAQVPVAPGIGVDPETGAMSAVHTHEADGTIHIEAGTAGERFTLGQLFTQWGIKLTTTQIGGVTVPEGRTLTVRSNGEVVAGDPAALRLSPEQEIVVEIP